MTDPSVKDAFLAALPGLRAFSTSMCGRTTQAEDLVQETLVKAWAHIGSFEPGSNMNAWLYTICRNEFYTVFRKRRHEVGDSDGHCAALCSNHHHHNVAVSTRACYCSYVG
jgi:RNA polymerase sigma-70 factor (ECF subfamily)